MIDEEIGMPAKRELSMRQLRHLLRLHHDGVSAREIGRRLGVARSTIQDNLKRAAAAGLKWPLGDGVTEEALELQLFGRAGIATGQRRRVEPDWAALARELKRPGVTMMILWEEYREVQLEGYGYSRFCDLLRGFERRLTPVMRQHHVAGEKAFVDYSGKRIGIADPTTGEIREAEIFVGVLGASNLTYAEASWTQQLADWTGAHVRMFRFFGGVPKLLVPDNLKSGVTKASFYDPEINRTYGAMAAHYSVGILPARPKKPRDKAKVEAGVRFAQTYILGRLRRLTFFSLAECNEAIALVMQTRGVMRISINHVGRAVAGDGHDFSRSETALEKLAGRFMAQVVKMQIFNTCKFNETPPLRFERFNVNVENRRICGFGFPERCLVALASATISRISRVTGTTPVRFVRIACSRGKTMALFPPPMSLKSDSRHDRTRSLRSAVAIANRIISGNKSSIFRAAFKSA